MRVFRAFIKQTLGLAHPPLRNWLHGHSRCGGSGALSQGAFPRPPLLYKRRRLGENRPGKRENGL